MQKVLVTDCESRKALCAVRSLGKQGFHVIAGSDKKINMSRSSKYCASFVHLPNPIDEKDIFLEELESVIDAYEIDVVMPMEDETVGLIISNIEVLNNTKTLLPEYDSFMIARDKGKTMKNAIEHGITCPTTYFLNDINELQEIISHIEYPAIIKPRLSSGSRGIAYVENSEQLNSKYKEIHEDYPLPIVQRYITGEFDKIQVLVILDQNHELKAACTYQGIREFPVEGGPVTLWKTISLPEIENKTIEFMKKIRWTGFAEVEFIVDQRTGEYFLMEINPRFSANIALAVQLGTDFPNVFAKLALNKKIDLLKNNKFEEYCQWLIPGDILNFVFNKDRFEQEIGYFLKKPTNIHYAIFSKDDFKPIVANVFSLILNTFGNIKNLKAKLSSSKR
ncbi:ATP-grasp domain-containing protein [Lentibacillus sp. CBA3610]|uniref:carboxylate--amine ligase n=1 Tax=Lentibacillus sp. CBA3610 TaxID=2518176 RepID=UPI0015955412|nr:ATP-grasp domain-containing protein [Lentibacillus sp. CBA3610]QKY70308.1 ATP-grasp domain-containing protein [Lentibacillus sp. CBA3610]